MSNTKQQKCMDDFPVPSERLADRGITTILIDVNKVQTVDADTACDAAREKHGGISGYAPDLNKQLFNGKINRQQFAKLYAEVAKEEYPDRTASQLEAAALDILDACAETAPFAPMVEMFVPECKKQGFHVAVASDTWAGGQKKETLDVVLRNYDPKNVFFSYQVGASKKEGEPFFLPVCTSLGVKPEQCAFIDDNDKVLTAAAKAGIKAPIFFDTRLSEQLLPKLLKCIGSK